LLRHNKTGKNAAEKFLAAVSVHSFDRAAAKEAATIHNKLKETGK